MLVTNKLYQVNGVCVYTHFYIYIYIHNIYIIYIIYIQYIYV